MKLNRIVQTQLAATALAAWTMSGEAADKPAWLAECSLGVKESYDNNVFQSGVNPADLPPVYTVPSGSVAALKDSFSWITTVSPKFSVGFAPRVDAKNLPSLSLAYSPDFVFYHNQDSECFNAHRVLGALKASLDSLTLSADNAFTYIDGADFGPTYPGSLLNAFATMTARERRRQIQDRANVSIQYDWKKHFLRTIAALTYYDLMTEQINVPGYQNYADRYDVNGGVDFGWKFLPQCAVTLGYRYGHQYQEPYSFSPVSSSSDYQRVLLGLEGNPCKWLNLKISTGPDFRDYESSAPVDDYHPVKFYGTAQVTASLAPETTLSFKYKSWQWVSGSGRLPQCDGSYELIWGKRLLKPLSFNLSGRLAFMDYTSGNLPTSQRNDLQYSLSPSLTFAINKHVSANLGGTFNWGRNAEDGIANPQTRELDQQLVSLGVQWKH